MKYAIFFAALMQFCFTACNCQKKAQNTPNVLINRYNSLSPVSPDFPDAQSLLDVKALVSIQQPVDTTRKMTFTPFDLKGQGQNEILAIFAQKDTAAQQRVLALLNQKFPSPTPPSNEDNTQQLISIILSTALKGFFQDLGPNWSAGDRIQRLRITIELKEESKEFLEFKSWDKVQTQYATYNAAGVSYSASKTWNIAPSVGIAGATFSLGSYNTASGDSAGDSLRYSVVLMTGTLTKDSLSIQEEGNPSQSLFGNTTLLVQPAFKHTEASPRFEFTGLQNDKGIYQEPTKVKVKEHLVFYPQVLPAGIGANLHFYYEIRHILKNAETIPEGDDDIQILTGHATTSITLVKREDVSPVVWRLHFMGSNLMFRDTLTKAPFEINFSSYPAAEDFFKWLFERAPLAEQSIKIANYEVIWTDDQNRTAPLNRHNFTRDSLFVRAAHY